MSRSSDFENEQAFRHYYESRRLPVPQGGWKGLPAGPEQTRKGAARSSSGNGVVRCDVDPTHLLVLRDSEVKCDECTGRNACPNCHGWLFEAVTDAAVRCLQCGKEWRLTPPEGSLPLAAAAVVSPSPVFVLASQVSECEQEWLFPNLAPLGTLALLAGDGGTGKSTLLRELAARATRAQSLFPGQDAPPCGPVAVLYLASEDSATATLVPGLREAGADLERVSIIDPESEDFPTFPSGLDVLRERIVTTGAKLVILDCATDFMDGRLNPDKEADIRALLRPLRSLAGELGFAIIVAVHVNKSKGGTARDRIMGGVAWRNAARHVVLMASPPDAEDAVPERLVVTVKSNIALRGEGYSLRVMPPYGSTIPSVGWMGQVSGIDPNSLVAEPASREEMGRQDEAEAFVRDLLEGGDWHASADIKKGGLAEGHKRRTVERAADDLAVEVKEEGFPRRTSWRLPQSRQPGMAPLTPTALGATGATGENPHGQRGSATENSDNGASRAMSTEMAQLAPEEGGETVPLFARRDDPDDPDGRPREDEERPS